MCIRDSYGAGRLCVLPLRKRRLALRAGAVELCPGGWGGPCPIAGGQITKTIAARLLPCGDGFCLFRYSEKIRDNIGVQLHRAYKLVNDHVFIGAMAVADVDVYKRQAPAEMPAYPSPPPFTAQGAGADVYKRQAQRGPPVPDDG